MNRGLVWLAARRTGAPWVLALFALAALMLVRRDWGGELVRLEAHGARAIERGFARAGVWLGLLLLVLPVGLGQAAGIVGRWRRGECDWLAPRERSRFEAVLASWAGVLLGGCALLLAAGLCAEFAAGGAPPSLRSVGTLAARGIERLDGGRRVAFTLEDPGDRMSGRLAFELGLRLDSGVSSDLALRVRRAGADAPRGSWSETRRRLGSAARIDVALPAGVGELEVELERLGDGALLVLDPRAQLLEPVRSEAQGSLALLAHALLALAALAALAFGLAAWTRPAIGSALLGAAFLALLLSGADSSALAPGSSLAGALAIVQAGRVPAAPSFADWAGALVLTLAGLGLAAAGHSPWRRAA